MLPLLDHYPQTSAYVIQQMDMLMMVPIKYVKVILFYSNL